MMKKKYLMAAVFMAATSVSVAAAGIEADTLAAQPTEAIVETTAAPAGTAAPADARGNGWEKFKKAFDPSIKFGGYIIGQFTAKDQKGAAAHTNFNLRLVRLYLNGYCFGDFYYRLQLEVNGQPGEDKGPRIVDAFVEWQHWDEFRVKLGQFKRSFGFENPMNPLDVGHGSYSFATQNLLFTDRNGAHSTSGRDVGVQAQGDFFPAADGHKWLHYQVGLFNGQGINHADKDNFKDLIGGLWIAPVKELRIGGFGWNGKYTNEKYDASDPNQLKSVKRVRWGVGVDYESKWVVRSEYFSSVGGVVTNKYAADRSDAWYATVGAPVTKNLKVYARWDCYRDNKQWNSLMQNYGVSANWWLCKNLLLQANYYLTDTRTGSDRYYNTFDLQVATRF